MYYFFTIEREFDNDLGHDETDVQYLGAYMHGRFKHAEVHDVGSATEWKNGERNVTHRAWSTEPFAVVITNSRHDAAEPTVTVTVARRLPEGGIVEEN